MNTAMQMNGMQPGQPGAGMMMQHGPNGSMGRPTAQPSGEANSLEANKVRLNTAIYDYFLKMGEFDLARGLKDSRSLQVKLHDTNKRKAEDEDSKDDINRPADLPPPFTSIALSSDTAFLLDWYSLFFELMLPQNDKNKSLEVNQYSQHSMNANRLQHQHQQNMLRQGMLPGNPQQMTMLRQNMMNRGGQPMMNPQMALQRQRMMQGNQHLSGMEGDGNRPRTPSSGENAPSPSKRARLEGQPFGPGMPMNGMQGGMANPQMMHQQRGQDMLITNGINPSALSAQQLQNFNAQNPQVMAKSIEVYKANMAAHTMQRANMAGQGSPMMTPGMEMSMANGNGDFYGNQNMNRGAATGQPPNGHALQDYQMQLMLLERQNRKRLEMAKQEQEVGGVPSQNGNMMPGQFAPNMSPSGSHQGPSPNPSDQMKRGTPSMAKGNMPGSPMPEGGPRASPGAMNYNPMAQGMQNGQNGMQPPGSHPNFPNGAPAMNAQQMAAMQNGRPGGPMQGGPGFPPGQQGPMGPGNQQGGMNGNMTPRQTNAAMPPPAGVPPVQNATGRAPSPAPSAAASTPQQTNRPAPNKKKDVKKDRKASTKKSAAAAAAAASSAENNDNQPPASTPATPITPAMNANNAAFEQNKASGANAKGPANGVQASVPPQVSQPAASAGDVGQDNGAQDMGLNTFGTDLDFANLEAGDVLDQFNFDAFIENSESMDNFSFDMGGFDGSGMEVEGA